MAKETGPNIGQTEAVVKAFNRALPKKPIYYFKDGEENGGKFTGPQGNIFHLQDVLKKTDLGKLFLTNSHETGKPAAYLLVATNFPDWDLKVVELEPFNERIKDKPNGQIVKNIKRRIDAKEIPLRNQPINVLLYQVRNRAVTNYTVIERLKKAMSKHGTQPTVLQLLLEELKTIESSGNEPWKTASIIELTGEDLKSKLMVYLHSKPEKPVKKSEHKESSGRKKQEAKIPAKKVKSKQVNDDETKNKTVSRLPVREISDENKMSPEAEARKKLELEFIYKLTKGLNIGNLEYIFLDDIRKGMLYEGILNLWKEDTALKEGLIPNFETFIAKLQSLDDPKKIGIDDELITTQYSAMRSIILGLNGKQRSDFSSNDISLIKTKIKAIKEGGNKEEVEGLLKEIIGKI